MHLQSSQVKCDSPEKKSTSVVYTALTIFHDVPVAYPINFPRCVRLSFLLRTYVALRSFQIPIEDCGYRAGASFLRYLWLDSFGGLVGTRALVWKQSWFGLLPTHWVQVDY